MFKRIIFLGLIFSSPIYAVSRIEFEGEMAKSVYNEMNVEPQLLSENAVRIFQKKTQNGTCQERIWIFENNRQTYWCSIFIGENGSSTLEISN